MRVLFSPVGGSDPIKRMLDGPMLHCCRVYKPDVVYIYFTAKMLEYENKDGRYTYAVNKLGEAINHKFEIKKIERPDLSEAHLFDAFYDDYDKILKDIEREYPGAEIYVNASSGTPAMKSAIVITTAMSSRKIRAIQVSGGEKKPMHDREHDHDYDMAIEWETNMDNEGELDDRTHIIESPRFLAKIKKENIIKYIEAYDYNAASVIAHEMGDYISNDAVRLIDAAQARLNLDYNGVKKALGMIKTKYDIIPIKDDKKRRMAEYLLWLDITLKKKDYLSFIRGITPIAMAIMETVVKTKTSVGDIKKYCDKKEYNSKNHSYKTVTYILSREKLFEDKIGQQVLELLDENYKSGFDDRIYSTEHLQLIIDNFCADDKIRKDANTIRKAESEIRNQAAHTIVAVDDNFIKNRIGISSAELYNTIKRLAVKIGLVPKSIWTSYEDMNELIINLLTSA